MFSGLQGEFEAVAVVQIAGGGVVNKNRGFQRGALKPFCAIEVDCGGGGLWQGWQIRATVLSRIS